MDQQASAAGKLNRLAERMMDEVRYGSLYSYAKLPHGLELVYERTLIGYRLALARAAPSRPSDTEEAVCRKAFGVPAGADSEDVLRHGADGVLRNLRNVTWLGEEEGA